MQRSKISIVSILAGTAIGFILIVPLKAPGLQEAEKPAVRAEPQAGPNAHIELGRPFAQVSNEPLFATLTPSSTPTPRHRRTSRSHQHHASP